MKTITYDELMDNPLTVLKMIQGGEEIIIKNVQTQEKVAVIIPYNKYQKGPKSRQERRLGILKGKASFKINDDFKIADEELLSK